MGKKILRGLGYFFCAILIILCIVVILAAAAFGSQKTVDVFGYNIFIVESDGFESAPQGSAVLVRKCGIQELQKGNLILWENNGQPSLGYIREIKLSDGVYSLTLNNNGKEQVAAESQIIGHAELSSMFLGQVVVFIRTPMGVFCIAVLPCIVLILFDIIRACAKKDESELEVEPQFKNTRLLNEQPKNIQNETLGVNSDGKAALNRSKTVDPAVANQILFELASRQQKKAATNQPAKINSGAIPSDYVKASRSEPIAEPKGYPKAQNPAVIGAYSKSAENILKSPPLITSPVKDRTAEISSPLKRDSDEAFFTQTSVIGRQNRSAPQIGKPAGEGKSEIISNNSSKSHPKAIPGRKSSQILATKSIDDLISDDNDYRDNPRTNKDIIDDILADINRNDNI